jgi:hypothetical protein
MSRTSVGGRILKNNLLILIDRDGENDIGSSLVGIVDTAPSRERLCTTPGRSRDHRRSQGRQWQRHQRRRRWSRYTDVERISINDDLTGGEIYEAGGSREYRSGWMMEGGPYTYVDCPFPSPTPSPFVWGARSRGAAA